jgi:hypothetical protein
MTKNLGKLGTAALAVLLGAASAQAATISGGSFSNPLSTTEITQTGTLDLFDSSLGTLTSVTLTLTGGANTMITLMNSAAQSQTASAEGQVDLSFSSSIAGLNLSAGAIFLAMNTGTQTIASGGTYSSPLLSDSDSTTLNPAAGLFSVNGGGTFTITCESVSGVQIKGGGGNVDSSQTTNAGCGASISYDYTPRQTVPEPGTMALLGLGVLGLGVARRRFNS